MQSTPRTWLLIGLAAMAASIVVSLRLGQDVNWDLRNYHFYDGWALVNGAVDRDLWPSQLQTFFNPVLPALAYLLIANMPPWAAATVLSAVQSANLVLLAAIAGQVFPRCSIGRPGGARMPWIVATVLIGGTGPMMLTELGGTFGDNIASIFILGALAALGRCRRDGGFAWIALAGLAAGVAAGLKPVNAVYVVGLIACGWWLDGEPRKAVMRLLWFCATVAFGILLSYGPWGWHLWLTKGNPVFPLMNNVFQSPWRPPDSLRDERFLPHSVLDALSYPFQWAVGRFPTSEFHFRDARFALAWLLVLAGLYAMARSRTGGAPGLADRSWLRVIVLFWASSFCIWIASFAIQRYLLPLELLSGVVIAGLVESACSFAVLRRIRPTAMAAGTVLLLATTRAPDYGRLAWSDDWFDVRLPIELSHQDQIFVILSGAPVAYVIPYFPPSARFVRLDGNLPLVPGTGLYEAAQAAIAGHKGPIASLAPQPSTAQDRAVLALFGLRFDGDRCLPIATRIERLLSCPLSRISNSSFLLPAGTAP